jgi:hypothetical protein
MEMDKKYLYNTRIFICMRLAQILIQEGRKEDLRKKYTEKFKEYPENLEFILGISYLKDKNFKYSDFVLKNTHPNASPEEVEHIIDLVKDFDRFQQSLEVKDINQYDLVGLQGVIDRHKSGSKSYLKGIEPSGVKKIYEDKNILIVRPLTHAASCKYGAGTRWCTTQSEPSYFKKYTSDFNTLYYIILKQFNIDNKFYKIAISMTPHGEEWYDSTDEVMSEREKEVFNLGAPKVIQTIREDYSTYVDKLKYGFIKNIFNPKKSYRHYNVTNSFGKPDHRIAIEFLDATDIPDMPGHAMMTMNISVDGENIDQYYVMIVCVVENLVEFKIGFSGDDFEVEPEFDFKIEGLSINQVYGLSKFDFTTDKNTQELFDDLCNAILSRVINKMKDNDAFMKYINDGEALWYPNRNYGFTFKENKGLVKKLVDYLDAGNDNGTKLDFLEKIGILKKKTMNGREFYSRPNQNDWHISSKWRGQHSSFFNSAKLAGIIRYEKDGNRFIIKPGPNFEAFKSGELKAL